MIFDDRTAAGEELGRVLARSDLEDPVVVALPRGGVPVAFEIAHRLHAPLDVLVARKVGAPGRRELGVGAICEGDVTVWDTARLKSLGLTPADLGATLAEERTELQRRVHQYRGNRPLADLHGRTAVVVDDGLATGVTAEAALQAVRDLGAARVVLAVPVGAPQTVERLGRAAEVVCLEQPRRFGAVGQWYRNFRQVGDEAVLRLLQNAARRR